MREKCDRNADTSQTTPGELPLTIVFKQLGLEYKWPQNLKTDAIGLLKCLNPEAAGQLPRAIFGDYKQPFDIKEFYWNRGMLTFDLFVS